jgi:hypothetical protein
MEDDDNAIVDRPGRSPRAASSEPSLACRNASSDEDELSVTRKRPRLDSGSRAIRSMSADVILSPFSKDSSTLVATDQIVMERTSTSSSANDANSAHTPTNITINLGLRRSRQPRHSMDSTSEQNDDANHAEVDEERHDSLDLHPSAKSSANGDGPASMAHQSDDQAPDSPVLLGSSPSIPIEIEDVNGIVDIDDDDNDFTAIEIEGDDDLVDRFIHDFPYLISGGKVIAMAKSIVKHLETEYDADINLLANLLHWLESQDKLFRSRHYWHELFNKHSVLWDHVSNIFYKLFSRGYVFHTTYHLWLR